MMLSSIGGSLAERVWLARCVTQQQLDHHHAQRLLACQILAPSLERFVLTFGRRPLLEIKVHLPSAPTSADQATMGILRFAAATSLALFGLTADVQARTICTVVADTKSGDVLHQEGQCSERFTPASTFKIALSVMGFDSGFLQDAHSPVLSIQPGDADWGGDSWRRPIDPTSWMKHSVVWYSQRMAAFLGQQRLHRYAADFGYGNADLTGDAGKDNGLRRAWLSSSLKVSSLEQVQFLARLVNRELPVKALAMGKALRLVEKGGEADGWAIFGKTGFAYPRKADGEFDEDHPWGWYVGWASKGERTLVFARLIQDDVKTPGITSWRSRDELIKTFASLVRPAFR